MQTYLTLAELSLKLGSRSRSAIYVDVKLGRLPKPLKLGARVYWPEAEVEAYLQNVARAQPMAATPQINGSNADASEFANRWRDECPPKFYEFQPGKTAHHKVHSIEEKF